MKLFTAQRLDPRHLRRSFTALLLVALAGALLAATGPSADAGVSAPRNPAAINIAQATTTSPTQSVTPYPSSLSHLGMDGPITDVNVDLDYVTLGVPSDIEILLVSPRGTAVQLYSDSCLGSHIVSRAYWTFDDEAAQNFPVTTSGPESCGSGSYRPTDWSLGGVPEFPSPAPPGPYTRALSAFDGENPNGTWRLYVADDTNRPSVATDRGVILNGFRVIITTQSQSVVVPPSPDGTGPASTYPLAQTVTGQNGRIRDMFVYLRNIGHSRPDDLDVLLVAPGGQKVMLMSDACGGMSPRLGTTFRFNDDDPPMPDGGPCNTVRFGGGSNFRPTNFGSDDTLPAPAPPGPYGTSLDALRGLDPNGTWRLFVHDDLRDHSGYLDGFQVSFDLAPPSDVPPPPPETDRTAPHTTIAQGPQGRTRSRQARFTFSATETPATFQCRIDRKAWTSCTSPKTYRGLAKGRHVFAVRASDKAGNQDPTPATRSWRIRR